MEEKMENQNPEEEKRIKQMIDELVEKAKKASQEYLKLDQKTVDNITRAMSMAGLEHHMELAKMAVEETQRGIYEDKITKNMFATEYIYHSIKHEKTVGIIKENEEDDYAEIAEPIGIIAGVTPVTNPTSTTMFKSIISAKTRNVIIFGFHPSAQKCSRRAAEIMRDAAIKAGAPENCILWIEEPSITATRLLMNHLGVNLILATGGTGMVKSAYSCGKPALGVGPGNVPCYIDKTAKLKTAVNDLVMSKSFDNGMICASEQAVLVDKEIYQEFEKLMREAGCYFVNPEEKEKLKNSMFGTNEEGYKLKSHIPGRSPAQIAKEAGFEVPKETKVLVVYEEGIGAEYPFSKEKLSPVLTYYIVNSEEEGLEKAERLLEFGGLGHSAVIHSENRETILKFSEKITFRPDSGYVFNDTNGNGQYDPDVDRYNYYNTACNHDYWIEGQEAELPNKNAFVFQDREWVSDPKWWDWFYGYYVGVGDPTPAWNFDQVHTTTQMDLEERPNHS